MATVDVIADRERFTELHPAWDALAAHSGTPLSAYEWYLAALDAQAGTAQPNIILVRENEHLLAAAPFGFERLVGARRLIPLDRFACEPNQILAVDRGALRDLAEAVTAQGQPLHIPSLTAQGPEIAALSEALGRRAIVLRRKNHSGAFVRTSGGFEMIEKCMSGSRRSALKRKAKAAVKSLGPMQLELLAPTTADVDDLLTRLIRLEGSGWKAASGTSMSADARMRRFIQSVARAFAKVGLVRMALLRFGEHEVACRLMIEWKHTWSELKIGYDENYARFAPGLHLTHETLRQACENGISRFEFLGFHEPWHNYWPRELRHYESLRAYPFAMSSAVAFTSDALRAARSRLSSSLMKGA